MTARAAPREVPNASDGAIGRNAVRVSLAPASAHADLAPLVVAPSDPHGPAPTAELHWSDAERAVLQPPDRAGIPNHILLLPGSPAGGTGSGVLRREVVVDGWRIDVDIEPAARAALRDRARRGRTEVGHSGPTEVRAMIPGVVVSIVVSVGDAVTRGQRVVVLEAMKMQNELLAPRDGQIERIAVANGDKIEVGDLLLVIS